jgi:hypothetical protein
LPLTRPQRLPRSSLMVLKGDCSDQDPPSTRMDAAVEAAHCYRFGQQLKMIPCARDLVKPASEAEAEPPQQDTAAGRGSIAKRLPVTLPRLVPRVILQAPTSI